MKTTGKHKNNHWKTIHIYRNSFHRSFATCEPWDAAHHASRKPKIVWESTDTLWYHQTHHQSRRHTSSMDLWHGWPIKPFTRAWSFSMSLCHTVLRAYSYSQQFLQWSDGYRRLRRNVNDSPQWWHVQLKHHTCTSHHCNKSRHGTTLTNWMHSTSKDIMFECPPDPEPQQSSRTKVVPKQQPAISLVLLRHLVDGPWFLYRNHHVACFKLLCASWSQLIKGMLNNAHNTCHSVMLHHPTKCMLNSEILEVCCHLICAEFVPEQQPAISSVLLWHLVDGQWFLHRN